ncbi:MAG TPA: hypothetical protein VFW92_05810 [Candidatus Limnocylindrales bacterium]|nr:hypothetical protein [Candidatus Limnocylindrales bacterium]
MLARLKELFQPLRPVLMPVWRPVRPLIQGKDAPVERLHSRLLLAWDGLLARRDRISGAPIRPLRKREFDALAARVPYYRGRWGYMSLAGKIAAQLIEDHKLETALELGPHIRPLIVGADVMDLRVTPDLQCEGRVIIHDATETPWPFEDKAYGLFVGLQVFEHLGTGQAAAFSEVRRVARHAIISLPIDWEMDDPRNVHHMLSDEKALSWFAPVVPTRVELGTPGRKKRYIYVFEDLPA